MRALLLPNQQIPSQLLSPTSPSERIQELDLLRGFAILGMFYVHMTGLPWDWALEAQGQSELDSLLTQSSYVLFSTKAFSLFSILFGFGFALQMQRAELRNRPFLPVYLRRMLGLFIIGNAIWLLGIPNDVLILYAIFAILLMPLRNSGSGTIFLAGGLFASVYIVADMVISVPEYFGHLKWLWNYRLMTSRMHKERGRLRYTVKALSRSFSRTGLNAGSHGGQIGGTFCGSSRSAASCCSACSWLARVGCTMSRAIVRSFVAPGGGDWAWGCYSRHSALCPCI